MTEIDSSTAGPGTRAPTVLFLDNSWSFGGAIESLKHLARELARRGVRPVVVSGQSEGTLREAFPDARTLSKDVRLPSRHPTALLRRMRKAPPDSPLLESVGLNLAAADWHLRRTLPASLDYMRIGRRYEADVLHLNNIVEGQLDGVIAAKLLGVPCVAHARGFQSPGILLKTAVRHVDHQIAISRAIADNLEEVGADPADVSIVPDGIDVAQFSAPRNTSEIRKGLGIPGDAPCFGLFGRIMEWKGTREFVIAAARVLEQLPEARALVVGDVSDGEAGYLDEVRGLANGTGVGDRILFTGYRDDIPGLMQALDLVVHTSIEAEPFGMVIVEAMAAGTPVVAADDGGPRDIVRDGETGLLVDPTDAAALASAILAVLQNPGRARALGEAGQERARRLYDSGRYADRVMDIYARVLDEEEAEAGTG